MLKSTHATGGLFVAPHHLAAQAGRDVLKAGGTAVEAMVAAAATIAVVYPHMNAIGGDGFWLIHEPGKQPLAIDACGSSAALADRDFYAGHAQIPSRGPLAALTVAGTVGGWAEALAQTAHWGPGMPLSDLLSDAIGHARRGIVVSRSQAQLTQGKLAELKDVPGFADVYLNHGQAPKEGDLLRQPALAETLQRLADVGLDDFYRGELATRMAADLERLGSPLRLADLQGYRARAVEPLSVRLNDATLYNMPPPTQGLASLLILGIFEKLAVEQAEGFEHVHGLVEATKQAFLIRDRVVTDPGRVPQEPQGLLDDANLQRLADAIDPQQALPWPQPAAPGDTIWMGCIDEQGRAVSFIQSVYWEFGSGVVLPSTGVAWQNRGISFSLDPTALQTLEPGRKPFHTLNPALALFDDGRTLSYGTMGGEGQPQTQAAILSRYRLGSDLQAAVSAPRWLLGRTWGDVSTTLKLESRFPSELVERLRQAGHVIDVLDDAFSDTMGHAGALLRHPNGILEGAADPRSDGSVCGL
ncbi:gamma-glutamyltranspeptidase/glutathione hydrolase [Pseudomonas sp. BIGb0408]|uniref:Gamma-glutamyltranspeptidase/glutathione hydrolase n=1 Tax=Phytopseudomonas flavescens TaxID=29435 RepID=A0A7Y9XQI1_9GAMM|nr:MULTISPECIES: gamma-glutamyltransferase family protein [Pseudomonas]MCW2295054.1 gamma-glutamyltranspeptidase/glutathione hydrolase [Pseudomonas sp. BIGb0408]NYH75672.1 gamma-glutamyltranspeptidase/glutathione hydrolase [Pseudomonas flavescens]